MKEEMELLARLRRQRVRDVAGPLRSAVRYLKNLTPEQESRYKALSARSRELNEEYNEALDDLSDIDGLGSDAQKCERILREVAIIERNTEQFAKLAREYRKLIIEVVARR